MSPTELFVYGTLRHDQPEHAKFCRGVTGWRPARMRAALWMLPAGYRIATVPEGAVLLAASADAEADEERRIEQRAEKIAAAARALEIPDARWIEGEVLSFRDAREAWPPLDRWEEFTPGGSGAYQRVVVPVVGTRVDGHDETLATWLYAATKIPLGACRIA